MVSDVNDIIRVLITGKPRVGKSSLVNELVTYLRTRKITYGGISTPEIRKGEHRIGFKIIDLMTGDHEILAAVNHKSPYRVGRYKVNLDALEKISIIAINNAIKDAQVIIIDEIGKMELFSKKFEKKILEIFTTRKHVVATIGLQYINTLGKKLENQSKIPINVFELTRENYEDIKRKLLEKIVLAFRC